MPAIPDMHAKNDGPCYNCEKRVIGCHSKCNEYKQFKENLEATSAIVRDVKNKENIVRDTLIAGVQKRYKKYKKK